MIKIQQYVVCLLISLSLPIFANPSDAEPSLISQPAVYDFGKRDTTETVQHTFLIQNTSDKPVSISEVKTSCGCTATKISRKMIPAGESAEITMSVDLWGMRGWVRKTIMVFSDDRPLLSLAMQGTVTRALEVLPDRLNYGDVERENTEERHIVLVTTTSKPIRITNVKAMTPDIECKYEPLAEGKAYAIRVGLKPAPGAMDVQGSIRILLDYAENPVIEVPVTARIINDINVLPSRLVIGGSGNDSTPRYIVFQKRKVDAFQLHVAKGNPDVSISVQASDDGYRVSVTPKSQWKDLHESYLLFTTDVPSMHDIQIPIIVSDPVKSSE